MIRPTVIKKTITYQESDLNCNYRLTNLLSTLSDLATKDALANGYYRSDMMGNYGWVLAKQTLKIKRSIKTEEEITFLTQAVGGKRVQFDRIYRLEKAGERLADIYSIWTLIDLRKRKIIRPGSIGIKVDIEVDTEQAFKYIPIREIPTEYYGKREVLYSDIDTNRHMNNSRYLEWVYDILGITVLERYYIKEVSMEYHQEIGLGQQVELYYGLTDNYFKIDFRLGSNVCFRIGGWLNLIEGNKE